MSSKAGTNDSKIGLRPGAMSIKHLREKLMSMKNLCTELQITKKNFVLVNLFHIIKKTNARGDLGFFTILTYFNLRT